MSASASPAKGWYARHWHWCVLGLLLLGTFLNYLDRQTLSLAIEPISAELGLDVVQRGRLLAAFVYSYAFSHLFIGFILDRVRDLRRFFLFMVAGWSLATMAVGWANSYSSMLWLRCALGVFEAANFPLGFLLISRLFPPRQKAFAVGVLTSGAILATLVAPKTVIYFSTHHDWRWAFIFCGTLGLIWLLPWWRVFREPEKRAAYWPQPTAQTAKPRTLHLRDVIGRRAFWAVAGVGVGIIPGLYFMTQWLPSYFTLEWKQDFNQALGNRLMLIYLMQDAGSLIGGLLVWWLAGRGQPLMRSRKIVIATAYGCTLPILALPSLTSVNQVVAAAGIYIFGLAMWMSIHGAFKQEVNRAQVGAVAALIGCLETGFAAFVVGRVGEMVHAAGGFVGVFALLGGFLAFAAICGLFLIRQRDLEP